MKLEDIGWSPTWQFELESLGDPSLEPARIVQPHRDVCGAVGRDGEMRVTVSGAFRHRARRASDFPTVGDWVGVRPSGDARVIEEVLPRRTVFLRKAAGKRSDAQALAANIDTVFLVCGLDGDLNLRRLERYLTLTWESGASPVVVLNKADLPESDRVIVDVERALPVLDVYAVSALTGSGIASLNKYLRAAGTIALLGSSGSGKSTLTNRLLGRDAQTTAPVRTSDSRGQHTTSRRELFALPSGGALVDTPGLRELGLMAHGDGLRTTFAEIEELAARCRFRDCRHEIEPGCAIREAVEGGTLGQDRYRSFLKMRAEIENAETRREPHRLRQRDRMFAKLVRRAVEDKRGR